MSSAPNIPIRNIYYMLAYAFKTLRHSEYATCATEDFDNIHTLFAAILSMGVSRQLKHGLYREYVGKVEDLNVLRGKINMPGTISHRMSRTPRITCEYDELSANNLLNQILKTAALLLIRSPRVAAHYRSALKRQMLFFSEVDTCQPQTIRWSDIRLSRSNQSYRMMLGVCQLLMTGMLLTTEDGQHCVAHMLTDEQMHNLYERFVLSYYQQEFPMLRARSQRIDWAIDEGERAFLPGMYSDISLANGNTELIIDTKYYGRTLQSFQGRASIHSGNLYQIFAYVKNRHATCPVGTQVSGMLLYARTAEELQPDCTFQMSGNTINVQTLDLNQEFSAIADALDAIAWQHFQQVRAGAARAGA